MLVYLSDVEEGGETVFLLEGKEGLVRLQTIDYKKCDTGIAVSVGVVCGVCGFVWGGWAGCGGPGVVVRKCGDGQASSRLSYNAAARPLLPAPSCLLPPTLPLSPVPPPAPCQPAGEAAGGRRAAVLQHPRQRHHRQVVAARRVPGEGGHEVGDDQVVSAYECLCLCEWADGWACVCVGGA